MPHVAPPWVGRLLLNPLRKFMENPDKILGPYVEEGMTILEPGCGMGYFTLPLARMVGKHGKIITVDVQQAMLDGLRKRLGRTGLADRVDARLVADDDTGVDDLEGQIDFVAAIHVVHETPDAKIFLKQMYSALKPGSNMLIIEPSGHVSTTTFSNMLSDALVIGFKINKQESDLLKRHVVLQKQN